ncbi:GNAT family N-acetyltransferase [Sulfitobacter sp. JBTF-M27]|uniref:GNAT family N-acetyltransferase n=1 Tax=Sulfitobacter sediminilitoris TaxID=2698830 RepID=A0A6P0CC47_9RHOB|nr:GNAT family N-acetyltransferase [Sulfitobacter sediminilitoris]NEK22920.1 GNAT family N-acetyltransferase [Sulfitobacter sediminilitoris]
MDALTPSGEDPFAPDVQTVLERHFDLMRSLTPEEGCHVIQPQRFAAEGVTLMGIRCNGVLLGIGALKKIAPDHGELKSMHTLSEARGQGVARAMLLALIAKAREEGLTRLSLETGTAREFSPARSLYLSEGFAECPPFADYKPYPLSIYMTRTL